MMDCDVPGGSGGASCLSASNSPNRKRAREPEDEVYLDNFHSQKRYLCEIMVSSLNGLTVGDSQSLPENIMDSPARSDAMYYLRSWLFVHSTRPNIFLITSNLFLENGEIVVPYINNLTVARGTSRLEDWCQLSHSSASLETCIRKIVKPDKNCYSPMSEDSDDSRYCATSMGFAMSQTNNVSSPTSPVSPQKHQKSATGLSSTSNSYPLPGCNLAAVVCHHSRQRGSDSEGRHPSSPNDMCHIADLRRAALLRSVQMTAQPQCSPAYELPSNSFQESIQSDEGEDRAYAGIKSSANDDADVEYGSVERVSNQDKTHFQRNSSAVKLPADRRRML